MNTTERNNKILELEQQGYNNREISEMIGGITQQRVSQIICDHKFAGRDDGNYALAADMFLDGKRFKEIGEALGVNPMQAAVYVKRAISKDYIAQRIIQYVNRRVVKREDTGCWEWQWDGSGKTHQRPQIFWKGKNTVATRLLWWALHGEMLDKQIEMCHTCDNIICVNPDHLFKGTQQDNMDDMVRKGRAGWQKPGWGKWGRKRTQCL
jgi:hypothetical protein